MTPRMARAYKLVLWGYLTVVPLSDLPGTRGMSAFGVFFGMLLILVIMALVAAADDLGDGNVERLEREANADADADADTDA